MDAQNTLRVETIDTLAGIRALRDTWLVLEHESADPHAAFQSYAWCHAFTATWCKGTAAKPFVLAAWDGEQLAGILPLQTSGASLRRVAPLGAPHTQVIEALVTSQDAADAIIHSLLRRRGFDILELGPVVEGGPLHRALLGSGEKCTPHPAEVLSAFDCSPLGSGEAYIAGLSKNRRRDYRRKIARLEELGPVRLRSVLPGEDGFTELLTEALSMKREWLKRTGTLSLALSDRRTDAFFDALNAVDSGGTTIEVEALEAGDTLLAVALNLVGHGQRACYLSAYDEAHHINSPGTLTHQLSIQRSIEEGLNSYSLLGYPTAFKQVWTNTQVPVVGWTKAMSPSGRLWLGLWIQGMRPRLKATVQRVSGWLAQRRAQG
ncbi:MAG: GNAT family N-acetyltransferase [Pseudomonadota bacterium]